MQGTPRHWVQEELAEMEEVALVIGQVSKMKFTQSFSNQGYCEMIEKNFT